MWLLFKKNARQQFKATLQGGARKDKVSERPKNVEFQYNSRGTSKKKLKAIMEKIKVLPIALFKWKKVQIV